MRPEQDHNTSSPREASTITATSTSSGTDGSSRDSNRRSNRPLHGGGSCPRMAVAALLLAFLALPSPRLSPVGAQAQSPAAAGSQCAPQGSQVKVCAADGSVITPDENMEVLIYMADTYTLQVPPGANFILLVQVKAVSGDVDLGLIGPPGSGINLFSNQRIGEQVLWLPAANVTAAVGSATAPVTFTINVIGYDVLSQYQLTVQTQNSVWLVPSEVEALKGFLTPESCDPIDPNLPIMCGVLQRATAPNHTLADDICSQPPSMCDSDGHLVKLVLLSSDEGNFHMQELPDSLKNLTRLVTLDMSMNAVYLDLANMASVASEMPQLQQLLAIQGRVYGDLDCSFFQHPSLMELYINNGNTLGGTLPNCLFVSSTITQLVLSGNSFVNTIPSVIPKTSPLTYLDLSGRSTTSGKLSGTLEGTIPNLNNASQLLSLDLSYNLLSGTIPPMTRFLVTLALSGNALNGTLPEDVVGIAPNLRTLQLDGNRFSGTIPRGLINSPLETLNLSTNMLTGSINYLWGNPQLEVFDVSSNQLSGELPYLLGALSTLRVLNLGGNKMQGDLSRFGFAPGSNSITYFNMSGNTITNGLPSSLQDLAVFSTTPVTSDPSGPTVVTNAFDVSNTGLNITFPLWLLDALGALYNQTGGDTSATQIDIYSGNNVIWCPPPAPSDTQKQYYYSVQQAWGLQCRASGGGMVNVTSALGYDTPTPTSPSPPKKSNAGAIAGGVIGALLGVAALAGVGWWLYKSGRLTRGGTSSSSSSRKIPLTSNPAYQVDSATGGSGTDLFSTYNNPLASGGIGLTRRA